MCDDNGMFTPKQCNGSHCWCVNPRGEVTLNSYAIRGERLENMCSKSYVKTVNYLCSKSADCCSIVSLSMIDAKFEFQVPK